MPRPLKIQPVSEFVTARQKADIEQLRLRQNQLIADKYRPLSIGISMLLPTVGSWLLMSSGGMLEDVWKNLLQQQSDALAVGSLKLLDEGLQFRARADQSLINVANSLPIKEMLKEMLRTLGDVGISDDPLDLIQLQADVFSDKQVLAIGSEYVRIHDGLKTLFIGLFSELAAFCNTPEINPYFSDFQQKHVNELGGFSALRSVNTPLLQTKTLQDLAGLIKLAYAEMSSIPAINPDNRDHYLSMISYLASFKAFAVANYKMMLGFVAFAVLFRQVIELVVNAGYHKIKKLDRGPVHDFLTFDEAEEKILALQAENDRLQVAATRNMYATMFLMVTALAIAISTLNDNKKESPALYVFIFSNLAGMAISFGKRVLSESAEACFRYKIEGITRNLNKSVACTDAKWTYVSGKKNMRGYFQFSAKSSGENINKIVKHVLARNGVQILAYEDDCVMISPLAISNKVARTINDEIAGLLERYAQIRKLTAQVKRFVEHEQHESFVKHVTLGEDRLPVATYEISAARESDLDKVKKIFSGCDVRSNGLKLFIEGCEPINKFVLNIPHSQARRDLTARDELVCPSGGLKRKKQVKKIEPAVEEKLIDEKTAPTVERIEFPSGVYDSSDPNCPIKKVNGLLNGKQYYVLFKLPDSCFSSPQMYHSSKNKVEEADIASSAKGAQGLQIRPTWVKNRADKKAGTFFSELRYKHKGAHGKGKVREYAQVEESADGARLGVFVGVDFKHKLRSV